MLHLPWVPSVHLGSAKPHPPRTSGTLRCLLTPAKVRHIFKSLIFPLSVIRCLLSCFWLSDVALATVLVPVLVMALTALILIVVCALHWRNRCVFFESLRHFKVECISLNFQNTMERLDHSLLSFYNLLHKTLRLIWSNLDLTSRSCLL